MNSFQLMLSFLIFSVPHYELVKIHSVRHTVSKRSIKSNPYNNAKDTLNSNNQYHQSYSSSSSSFAEEYLDRKDSIDDLEKVVSSPNIIDHGSENISSSDWGITDVRWNRFTDGSIYPSISTKMLPSSSSLPSSNPSPQSPRTSSASSLPFTCKINLFNVAYSNQRLFFITIT